MAENTTALYSERPDISGRWVGYTRTPEYLKHSAYEDKLAILVCQIKIWKPQGNKWFDFPSADKCLIIRECESVEITDSSQDLLNKAVVKFPRGTVISLRNKQAAKVKTGDESNNTQSENTLIQATNNGEVMTSAASTYSEDGVSTTSIAANYDDKGLVDFNRSENEPALLDSNDVAVGQRIEIRLGYAYSETEFAKMNATYDHPDLTIAFTGFITAISVNTPLELECTNMAHVLACVSTPNISAKSSFFVKDFLDEDGTYHLLRDTGIELDESSKKSSICVQGGAISNNLTVADVLAEWNKSGVRTILDIQPDGSVKLRVGLTYFAGQGGNKMPNNDKRYITYNGGNNSVVLLQFDWDVAQDKLSLKHVDKKYIAVEAQGRTADGKSFKLTVRKNPDADDEGWMIDAGEGNWQVVNRKKVKDRKKPKIKDGVMNTKIVDHKLTDPAKLKKYTVINYVSQKVGITEEELIEEAKQYWAKYVPNGISGSIEIFGDIVVRPTQVVGLIDMRQPEKNGYYFVDSVSTSFGVNGYRRELKFPYKIASFSQPVQII